jgi:hypothetical protein
LSHVRGPLVIGVKTQEKTNLVIGVVGRSWSAGCALWGEVYWPIRDPTENCILGRRCIKIGSRIFIALLRGKSEGGTNDATNKPTERNKDLSVIVFIKLSASGYKN